MHETNITQLLNDLKEQHHIGHAGHFSLEIQNAAILGHSGHNQKNYAQPNSPVPRIINDSNDPNVHLQHFNRCNRLGHDCGRSGYGIDIGLIKIEQANFELPLNKSDPKLNVVK